MLAIRFGPKVRDLDNLELCQELCQEYDLRKPSEGIEATSILAMIGRGDLRLSQLRRKGCPPRAEHARR